MATKHIICQKLATLLQKKDFYVGRLESLIFGRLTSIWKIWKKERSYLALSENSMDYWVLSYYYQDANPWKYRILFAESTIFLIFPLSIFFYISMYSFSLNNSKIKWIKLNNNKIKRNNTEDNTKACRCVSFLEKQIILNTS